MKIRCFILICLLPASTWSQAQAPTLASGGGGEPAAAAHDPPIINPFDIAGETGMEEMMDDMGMAGMMMGGMGGMEANLPDPEELFQNGLQRAILALKATQTDQQKTVLKGFIQSALEERYSRMITQRAKELQRLKQKIAQLESDLKRREQAKGRVVQVQMQSVELAAEGLLNLGNSAAGSMPGIGGMGGYGEESMEGGYSGGGAGFGGGFQ